VTEPGEPEVIGWVRGDRREEGTAPIDRIREQLSRSSLTDALERTAKAFASEGREALTQLDVPSAGWVDGLGAPDEAADYLRAFLAAMGGAGRREDVDPAAVVGHDRARLHARGCVRGSR
jgi:hypothetical protein